MYVPVCVPMTISNGPLPMVYHPALDQRRYQALSARPFNAKTKSRRWWSWLAWVGRWRHTSLKGRTKCHGGALGYWMESCCETSWWEEAALLLVWYRRCAITDVHYRLIRCILLKEVAVFLFQPLPREAYDVLIQFYQSLGNTSFPLTSLYMCINLISRQYSPLAAVIRYLLHNAIIIVVFRVNIDLFNDYIYDNILTHMLLHHSHMPLYHCHMLLRRSDDNDEYYTHNWVFFQLFGSRLFGIWTFLEARDSNVFIVQYAESFLIFPIYSFIH